MHETKEMAAHMDYQPAEPAPSRPNGEHSNSIKSNQSDLGNQEEFLDLERFNRSGNFEAQLGEIRNGGKERNGANQSAAVAFHSAEVGSEGATVQDGQTASLAATRIQEQNNRRMPGLSSGNDLNAGIAGTAGTGRGQNARG